MSLQGAMYGISRKHCDKAFIQEMKNFCARNVPRKSFTRTYCNIACKVYYGTVRIGGASSYKKVPGNWCAEPWARICLPGEMHGRK